MFNYVCTDTMIVVKQEYLTLDESWKCTMCRLTIS